MKDDCGLEISIATTFLILSILCFQIITTIYKLTSTRHVDFELTFIDFLNKLKQKKCQNIVRRIEELLIFEYCEQNILFGLTISGRKKPIRYQTSF
jgi:hypothetical protein